MEENTQKSISESKMFKIPIEKYEIEIDTEFWNPKKSEILDLFTNFSKLRSKKEFDEIEYDLRQAFELDNLEVIKIYLSETIENESQDLRFKIDKQS